MNKTTKREITNALFSKGFYLSIQIGLATFTEISSIERLNHAGNQFKVYGTNIYGEKVAVNCETID